LDRRFGLGGFGVKPRRQRTNLTVCHQLAISSRREGSLKKLILIFFPDSVVPNEIWNMEQF
jgi:hypothetical protein